MIDIEKLNAEEQDKQTPCMSCLENSDNMYLLIIRNHFGDYKLPICKECVEGLKLAIELEDINE